ncbi:MAG: RluA family pseudouridine synthase [Actinomycetota bacterium]|nr:RluA family pseudouridine synthase [Actinomycetota bacterium]
MRLDLWLTRKTGTPRTIVQRWIAAGEVTIDGARATKSQRVTDGAEVLVVNVPGKESSVPTAEFDVRFEDDHLAVINKPSGVVVHHGHGNPSGTLVDALADRMPLAPSAGEGRAGIVHRLDKETSGLLVVAKTDACHEMLVQMMKQRTVQRGYVCVVLGWFKMPTGRIEAPVGRSPRDPLRMGVTSLGKEAITTFSLREQLAQTCLVDVQLATGRTHQIRVHMAHIDHPVIGDRTYGARTIALARQVGLKRTFLHASSIRFAHPMTGADIFMEEVMPPDLTTALEKLRAEPEV